MTRERSTALVLVLALSWACAPSDDRERIVLQRAERDGWWSATYLFDRPADELRFQRPAGFYREDVWSVTTPGWQLERRGEHQWLVADAGASTTRVSVEFPAHTERLPKEYEFFLRFTDGSLAVYTGHLYATTEPAAEGVPEVEANHLRRIELVPRDGEHLVLRGRRLRGRTLWSDEDGDGTYIYFGGIDPLETEEMIAVVDPGAPGWLVERLHRLLPQTFAMYAAGFGESLPWKPVVLFNFEDVEQSGLASGGGALAGLVQMSATGHKWHAANPATSENLLYLIAHEAAHLWNSQLNTYEDIADSWMHEGSADAFAELALLRNGTIDAARLAERRSEALNRCVAGLAAGPLRDAGKRGRFGDYYSCGNLIAVWSFAALDGPAEFERLFDVWRAVFANVSEANSRYDRDSYFRALESLGVEAQAIDRLRTLVDRPLVDSATAAIELLASAGIEVAVLDRATPPGRRDRAVGALEHLMAHACDGRVSFHREWPRLRTAPLQGCEPFGRELRIISIEGHGVEHDGDRALASVIERCGAEKAVTLGLETGGRTAVPCSAALPPAPPPLAFPEM